MAESRDIFIVCNSIEELGGLAQWAHDIARLFTERGHHVHLIGITAPAAYRDYGSNLPYRTSRMLDFHLSIIKRPTGLRRLNVRAQLRARWYERLMRQVGQRLTEIFRSARPGGVIIVAQIWAMEWVAHADTAGLKVIGMGHESYEASRRSSRYARVKRFYADVDRFLVLTEEDADAWARDGMSNVGAMPNPLLVKPQHLPTLDEPVVVTLRRLAHDKGIDMLLEAWAHVAPAYPEWTLHVYGSGPDEEALRQQARDLGLDDTAIFRGLTTDIDSALSSASIYALPSREEGFPIAVMEAMAYGLPTVAFDCAPGIRELIDDEESGLVITPGNVLAFATALERLMKDRDLRVRMGQRARESVQRFSPDVIVDRWEALFDLLYR